MNLLFIRVYLSNFSFILILLCVCLSKVRSIAFHFWRVSQLPITNGSITGRFGMRPSIPSGSVRNPRMRMSLPAGPRIFVRNGPKGLDPQLSGGSTTGPRNLSEIAPIKNPRQAKKVRGPVEMCSQISTKFPASGGPGSRKVAFSPWLTTSINRRFGNHNTSKVMDVTGTKFDELTHLKPFIQEIILNI